MAKPKSSTPVFTWVFWFFMFLLPVFQIDSLQDESLLSRSLLLASFGMVAIILDKQLLKRKAPKLVGILLLAFALWSVLSNSWAYNPSETWAFVARIFAFVPLFFLLQSALSRETLKLDDLLKGVLFFALAAALPTLFQLLSAMVNGQFFNDIYSITGTFSHKNLLASALMLSFPFVLAAWVLLKGSWSKVAMAIAIIMLIEMFVLRTRGVWLGLFGASLGTGLILQIKKQKDIKVSRKWTLSLSAGGLLILVALFLSPQIKAGFTSSSNVQKRLAFWENSMEMIQEHPITGVGGGNWKLLFPKYGLSEVDYSTMQGITHIQRPHNDFIWLWAELGPLGLLLYLSLFIFTFVKILKNLGQLDSREDRLVNIASLFALIALTAFSFSDFPLERAPHMFFFMLIMAVAFMRDNPEKGQKGLYYFLPAIAVISIFVNVNRYQHETKMDAVLVANQKQDAKAIITSAEEAFDASWYTVDNYANPIQYYSGKGMLFTGREQEAIKELSAARSFAPYNILVLDAMVQYYARKGETKAAIALADSALLISPHFESLLLLKAQIHLSNKQFADALGALNMHDPKSTDQRYRGLLAEALRGALRTYPEHGRYVPMMDYLRSQGVLKQPMDYINAYRRKRGVS
jgi:O-antigen ligase